MAPDDAALAPPPAGHNQPPTDAELLAERQQRLANRQKELLGAFERAPETIADDDLAGKVGDLVGMIRVCSSAIDDAHRAEKEPYLQGGRMVDAWKNRLVAPLGAAKVKLEQRLTAYLTAKAERERKAREAEAARLQAQADALVQTAAVPAGGDIQMVPVQSSNIVSIGYAADRGELRIHFKSGLYGFDQVPAATHVALMASSSKGAYFISNIKGKFVSRKIEASSSAPAADADATLTQAVALSDQAAAVAASATARPADLSRTRGDMGSVASLKQTWAFEVTDITKVPAHMLMVNEAAVKAHVKARLKDQPPAPVAGIRFYTQASATVR